MSCTWDRANQDEGGVPLDERKSLPRHGKEPDDAGPLALQIAGAFAVVLVVWGLLHLYGMVEVSLR